VVVDAEWLAARLKALDSEKFTVREAALRELEKVAEVIESELRRGAGKPPSLEGRGPPVRVLRMAGGPPGEKSGPAAVRAPRAAGGGRAGAGRHRRGAGAAAGAGAGGARRPADAGGQGGTRTVGPPACPLSTRN